MSLKHTDDPLAAEDEEEIDHSYESALEKFQRKLIEAARVITSDGPVITKELDKSGSSAWWGVSFGSISFTVAGEKANRRWSIVWGSPFASAWGALIYKNSLLMEAMIDWMAELGLGDARAQTRRELIELIQSAIISSASAIAGGELSVGGLNDQADEIADAALRSQSGE